MYLHICKNLIINREDIIGVFDIETINKTIEYEKIYKELEEQGKIEDVSGGEVKTIILTEKNKEKKIYISNISVATLEKRANIENFWE